MPPRYAYWTIIVDDQPTAFRAGTQEDLLPTLKRLQAKQPNVKMMWWQNGKLWERRIDAQEAMRTRGELGRRSDTRQSDRPAFSDHERRSLGNDRPRPSFRDRPKPSFPARPAFAKAPAGRPSFSDRPRSSFRPDASSRAPREEREPDGKLGWKPKGEFTPAPKREKKPDWDQPQGSSGKPEWKPKSQAANQTFDRSEWKPKRDTGDRAPWKPKGDKPEWKPKGAGDGDRKPEWKPKSSAKPEWRPKPQDRRPRTSDRAEWKPRTDRHQQWSARGPKTTERPEWKPKSEGASRKSSDRPDWTPKSGHTGPKPDRPEGEKRKWVPKAEYKKSLGIEAKRDDKWRPGGEHKDPKQKYKDAKKAKWSKFKQNIRTRWEAKGGKKRREE
jgi:hypothetical protein